MLGLDVTPHKPDNEPRQFKSLYTRLCVLHGILLPSDLGDLKIWTSADGHTNATLRRNVQAEIDEATFISAVANLLLGRLMGGIAGVQSHNLFTTEQEKERDRINSQISGSLVLVLQSFDSINGTLHRPHRDFGDFIVGVDIAPSAKIRMQADDAQQTALSILFAISDHTIQTAALIDSFVLLDEQEKKYISLSPKMRVQGFVSAPISSEAIGLIHSWQRCGTADKLGATFHRLVAEAVTRDNNRTRRFLTSWCALEIFIRKLSPMYEKRLIAAPSSAPNVTAAAHFFDERRKTLRTRYTIPQQFSAIASFLCLGDWRDDYRKLIELKDIRDHVMHGGNLSEDSMPTDEILHFLRKYYSSLTKLFDEQDAIP